MIRRLCFLSLLALATFSCGKYFLRENQQNTHYSVKDAEAGRRINDSILRYKIKVDSATSRIIAFSEGEFTRDGDETGIGNLVCDAMAFSGEKYFGKSDVVLVNRGGLRANLPRGEIRVNHIFELMPFENEMIQVSLKGKDLKKVLPLIVAKKHAFKGMKIKIEGGKVSSVLIGDVELDESKNYTVLSSDYLYNGGDNFIFLKSGDMKDSGKKIRDAIIEYCEFQKTIKPYKDGRLEISK